ncbi:PIN domain nuclease, a component of toxin-antitoxin system (PIN domain) [Dyadobacter koreensis]|uniref:PIN domain nuclease, a component of toxin-antitoxin system (PIN domain) n=1 Tax=Dyadobacter koreensis TaxID=408657 RepID=A0A1H6WC67_9BACT|nr:type II toxin-antitoxin system VapC family toxin [Dyadobacter koreensis]SEJ12784.1 PIN domain nuclease, a component of toxin-antitoxin system (PIN domain) [Dyadobacter koreensis]
MNYILDTHTLIWFMEGDVFLSTNAKTAREDEQNTKYVSTASLWEIAIKISLGKLLLKKPLEEFLDNLSQTNINILPLKFSHFLRISKLEFIHKDPFDRIIICQSLEENLRIIGKDPNFPAYGVNLFW